MDKDLFVKILTELSPYLTNTNLYFQGEPMMHPRFFDLLESARDIPATVSTNGHFLTAENAEKLALSGLKKLIVSLDGLDQETYSAYRINGDAGKVIEGIRNLSVAKVRLSSKLKVELQVLVNRYNEKQVPDIIRLGKVSGFRVVLKSMQIYDSSAINQWLPSDDRFRRYLIKSNGFEIRSRLPRRCARLWFNPVVTWDGKVVPCCFDKDAGYVMGDLNEQSFHFIWHGEKFRQFRRMVLSGREKIPMCRNCTSGLTGVR